MLHSVIFQKIEITDSKNGHNTQGAYTCIYTNFSKAVERAYEKYLDLRSTIDDCDIVKIYKEEINTFSGDFQFYAQTKHKDVFISVFVSKQILDDIVN